MDAPGAMLRPLEDQLADAERAVLAAETSGKPLGATQLISALVERLQSGDDSIGVRGSDLALAQSKAHLLVALINSLRFIKTS